MPVVVSRRVILLAAACVLYAYEFPAVGEEAVDVPAAAEAAPAAEGTGKPDFRSLALAEPAAENLQPDKNGLEGVVAGPSTAEQITRLNRSIEQGEQKLAALRRQFEDPMNEFRSAEAAFKEADDSLSAKQKALESFAEDAEDPLRRLRAQELEEAEKKRGLARERFDLAIETRKTLQDQVAPLEASLRHERAALAKLTGEVQTPPAGPPAQSPAPSGPAPAVEPAHAAGPAVGTSRAPSPLTGLAPQASAATPVAVAAPAAAATPRPNPAASRELLAAESDAVAKKAEADAAEEDAQSVGERIKLLDKSIELEAKLLSGARKKADIALQTRDELSAEQERLSGGGTKWADLQELVQKRRAADSLFRKSRVETREHTDRLSELQTQRAELQQQELQARAAVKEKLAAAEQAARAVHHLRNPFSPHNLLQWLLDHGPRVIGIFVAMAFVQWLVRAASARIVGMMIARGAQASHAEQEDRAKTLAGVFQNAASVTVVVGGTLMVCEELGIAVGPLMGGAAVLGLAVAFGAQNLIRDYFYGFVILLENQYKLNDVLKIGDLSGQVEQITLRMTVLRDLDGHVHFVPNGRIESVTNMTHGWSRAVFDVGVAYKEDADHVMDLLMELAAELRKDPVFGRLTLDGAEMLGVENLGDSAVTIRFFIKTRPLKQWMVKREMLRRIKRRFDEVGIEIPFPQRSVHHRFETPGAPLENIAPQQRPRKSA